MAILSFGGSVVRVARPLHFSVDVAPFNGRDTAVHRMLIKIQYMVEIWPDKARAVWNWFI